MIKAVVTSVTYPANGRWAFAFVKTNALASDENRSGTAMFYVAPPFWTYGRPPHVGQQVVIARLEKITRPYWSSPRWRAFDVSPAWAVKQYSPKRLSEPTELVTRQEPRNWWAKVMAALGFTSSHARRAAA